MQQYEYRGRLCSVYTCIQVVTTYTGSSTIIDFVALSLCRVFSACLSHGSLQMTSLRGPRACFASASRNVRYRYLAHRANHEPQLYCSIDNQERDQIYVEQSERHVAIKKYQVGSNAHQELIIVWYLMLQKGNAHGLIRKWEALPFVPSS